MYDDWWVPEDKKKKGLSEEEKYKLRREREKRRLQMEIIRNQEIVDENERLDAEDELRDKNRNSWEFF